MHEVSIALNLLEIVSDQCRKNGYNVIESINVRIGKASGIMPDALAFAFDAVKQDYPARNASLMIDIVPLTGQCHDCKNYFTSESDFVLHCPECQGTSFTITAGREMDIIDMEVS